jgi:predicted RNA-binding Zn ribbon-like protein
MWMVMAISAPALPAAALVPAARDDLCLDYTNTVSWRGRESPEDALGSFDDLLAWCLSAGTLGADAVAALGAWRRGRPARAAPLFAEAVALREAIFRIFSAAAAGAVPAAEDLAFLNRALARAPARASLRRTDGGYRWLLDKLKPTVPSLLAPVLWSAGDLLAEARLARVRRCANDKCQWLFLDDSKSGTRRWCSMRSCGNRAKAHRHYLRHKQD